MEKDGITRVFIHGANNTAREIFPKREEGLNATIIANRADYRVQNYYPFRNYKGTGRTVSRYIVSTEPMGETFDLDRTKWAAEDHSDESYETLASILEAMSRRRGLTIIVK